MLSVCCCFVKQKAAYDVRISDWSSDVCSSDLLSTRPGAASFCLAFRFCPSLSLRAAAARRRCRASSQRAGERANKCDEGAGRADGESGVWGKRESISVGLGGPRSIKKKTQTKSHHTNHNEV